MTPQESNDELLLNAYLDGELDASAALAFERRLASEADLKAELERLAALLGAVGANVGKDVASDALRRKIAVLAGPPQAAMRVSTRMFDWRQMATSALFAALIASGGTLLALHRDEVGVGDIASLVAEHRRALLAASPLDVASSDQHTVKPWFDAKLALSPQVIDLSASGFPLAGGRVEVVGGKLVPAMVYRRREHLVSLVAVPRAAGSGERSRDTHVSQDGYTVLGWPGRDFDYYAISDIPPDDLAAFAALWRTAAR